jgi:hypothetical protein
MMLAPMMILAAATSQLAAAAPSDLLVDQPIDSGAGPPPNSTVWTDALTFGLRGAGWPTSQMTSPYTRLPSHAQKTLCSSTEPCAAPCSEKQCETRRCAVWGLSQTATGLHFKFATTATTVHVRFTMKPENGDWLWAFNGHSGIDMYVQDSETGGAWRWATSSGNNAGNEGGSMAQSALNQHGGATVQFTATLGVMAATTVPRNVTLYLPSRGALSKVEVGVAPGERVAALSPPHPAPEQQKNVVVYGTSILHGAAAGRAGMVYSSQMERYIKRPVVNLGAFPNYQVFFFWGGGG